MSGRKRGWAIERDMPVVRMNMRSWMSCKFIGAGRVGHMTAKLCCTAGRKCAPTNGRMTASHWMGRDALYDALGRGRHKRPSNDCPRSIPNIKALRSSSSLCLSSFKAACSQSGMSVNMWLGDGHVRASRCLQLRRRLVRFVNSNWTKVLG